MRGTRENLRVSSYVRAKKYKRGLPVIFYVQEERGKFKVPQIIINTEKWQIINVTYNNKALVNNVWCLHFGLEDLDKQHL